MDVSTGMGWRYPGTILQLCDLICQHRFGADGVDIAHTRKEENLDEGNNNGLEGVVKILEQVYNYIKTKTKTKTKTKVLRE